MPSEPRIRLSHRFMEKPSLWVQRIPYPKIASNRERLQESQPDRPSDETVPAMIGVGALPEWDPDIDSPARARHFWTAYPV